MAKRLITFIVAAAALAVLTPQSITAAGTEMNCRVPFSFVVSGKTLPPGNYRIDASNGTVIMRGYQDSAIVMSTGTWRPANRSGKGSVVFLRTGSRYELIEIWNADGSGREVHQSRRAKEERTRAAATPSERIVISAM